MDTHAEGGEHTDGGRLVFRNYAKAHRHGHVVGQLPGGHAIPFGPYTLTQVGVFVTALVGLYLARGLWMHFGRVVDLLVLVGVPYALAVAERFVRPEGRSPLRSVAALAGYATAPRGGRRRGRPLPTRLRRLPPRRVRIVVADLPAAGPAAPPPGTPARPGWEPARPVPAEPVGAARLADLLPAAAGRGVPARREGR